MVDRDDDLRIGMKTSAITLGQHDVRAVAEDEGIPIYVISTNEVNNDAVSSNVFKRISQSTGGKTYFARTWQKQVEAFEAIRFGRADAILAGGADLPLVPPVIEAFAALGLVLPFSLAILVGVAAMYRGFLVASR